MFVLYSLIGFVIGLITAYFIVKYMPKSGTLRIDRSDPNDEPYMFLEGVKSPYEIAYKRFVIFDVKREDYISHE